MPTTPPMAAETLSEALHEQVRVLSADARRTLLYDDSSGRFVFLSEDTEVRPGVRLRLERLGMAQPRPDLGGWIPHRCASAVLLPEVATLWHPVASQPRSGGHAYAGLVLDAVDIALWRGVNGARRCDDLAATAAICVSEVCTRLARMTSYDVQAIRMYPSSNPRRPELHHVASASERPDGSRLHAPYRDDGATSLGAYHHAIEARRHFDDVETTVAHAFARPHAALGGVPYGARLRQAVPAGHGALVVEIGPGSGELARDYTSAGPSVRYLRVDRSPDLLACQARLAPHTHGVLGDAAALPIAAACVDVLICNEVIADLAATPTSEDFEVASGPDQLLYNTGAFRLVREIARVLAPGGVAFVCEFGGPEELPAETRHLDHPEVSIHFGQLLEVARRAGLHADVVPLAQLLRADLGASWLSRGSYAALRARWPSLQARAWRSTDVPTPQAVEGLVDVPITRDGPAPVLTRFWALVARASNRCTEPV